MPTQVLAQITSIQQDQSSVTQLEDLSNELLYDIFDYLNLSDTYETFVNLNSRFHHLISHSFLPLNINFSLLSKSTFKHQCETILIPNMHRIISLRFSHYFLIEYFFKFFTLDSSYIRLQTLTFNDLKSEKILSILSNLTSLPHLFSLTLATIDKIRSRDIVYSYLLELPVLKYCKLSIDTFDQHSRSLLDYHTECSPIEHLVLDTTCNLNELIELLVYTPQLRRLSCRIFALNSSLSDMMIVPENLTNLHLQLEDTSFDEFEWFISPLAHRLQVLHISTKDHLEFFDADHWQRLITRQMPVLNHFLLEYEMVAERDNDQEHELIKKFQESFWSDRQWFFTHQHYRSKNLTFWIRFYSTQPYRCYRYQLHESTCQYYETGVNLAREVDFHSYRTTTLQFPRAFRLSLSEGNMNNNPSFIHDLKHIVSPAQITELIISDEALRFEQLLSLLHRFPHLCSLTIHNSILNFSAPQSATNRLQFPVNNISKLTILNLCTLEDVQILHRLFRHVQNLELAVERDRIEVILRFLLLRNSNRTFRDQLSAGFYSKNLMTWPPEYSDCIRCTRNQKINSFRWPCNHHISFLCFRDVNYRMLEKVREMIDREILLKDYSIEYMDQKLFLWW